MTLSKKMYDVIFWMEKYVFSNNSREEVSMLRALTIRTDMDLNHCKRILKYFLLFDIKKMFVSFTEIEFYK